jgi:hypothetical protein
MNHSRASVLTGARQISFQFGIPSEQHGRKGIARARKMTDETLRLNFDYILRMCSVRGIQNDEGVVVTGAARFIIIIIDGRDYNNLTADSVTRFDAREEIPLRFDRSTVY